MLWMSVTDIVGDYIDFRVRETNGKATWGDQGVEVHGMSNGSYLETDEEAHNQLALLELTFYKIKSLGFFTQPK